MLLRSRGSEWWHQQSGSLQITSTMAHTMEFHWTRSYILQNSNFTHFSLIKVNKRTFFSLLVECSVQNSFETPKARRAKRLLNVICDNLKFFFYFLLKWWCANSDGSMGALRAARNANRGTVLLVCRKNGNLNNFLRDITSRQSLKLELCRPCNDAHCFHPPNSSVDSRLQKIKRGF